MSAEDLHVESWSFNEGNRAVAPDFSIAIPDGWSIFPAKGDGERVFKAYPEGVTQNDIDEEGEYGIDGIFYCEMPQLPDETKDTLQDIGIDELVRAVVRLRRDGDANPMASATKKIRFVRGKNCDVMVAQFDRNAGSSALSGMSGGLGELAGAFEQLKGILSDLAGEELSVGYDIHIIPCMLPGNYIRLFCPNQDVKNEDDAFEKACEMAQTVELVAPLACGIVSDLNKCKSEKVDAHFFIETCNRLENALNAARDLEKKTADERFVREYKQASASGNSPSEDVRYLFAKHTIDFLSDFANRTTYYEYELLDAYRYQKDHGASAEDARLMIDCIGEFMTLFEMTMEGADPELQSIFDSLGNVKRPDDYEKLRDLIEAECPGYKERHDAERERRSAEKDEPLETAGAKEEEDSSSDSAGDYDDWWEPLPDDREPRYVGFNKQFDHNAACWLLYRDRIFFNDDEIVWDGHHHALGGMQVNATYIDQIPVFMERVDNYAPAFGDFMTAIEQDEGLIIPREMIHPVTQNALREGDLTGVTLLNLQACAMSLMITSTAPNQYSVFVDPRVLSGIPDFLNLMGRLIWDMREYNGVEAPFSVTLLGTRSFDANVFFGDDGFLDKSVAGATTELAATFSSKPTVTLPREEEIEMANLPFASGLDNPDEMQSDEELFEAFLMAKMRDFPLTVSIEGTHHLGRAQRIEDIEVGDKLVLASDWENKWFTPCGIEVFNDKGETLGYLSEQLSISLSGNRELALLLPYITATVESVTPLSKRRKNAKYALLDVHMEIDESVVPEEFCPVDPAVMSKAKATLRLPKPERITMSKSPLTYADLKGSIDVSAMKSDSEPENCEMAANEPGNQNDLGDKSILVDKQASSAAEEQQAADPARKEAERDQLRKDAVSRHEEMQGNLPSKKHRLLGRTTSSSLMSKLDSFYIERTSGSVFVSTSESIVGSIMRARQSEADRETAYSSDDFANLQTIARIAGDYNNVYKDCFIAYMDIIDRQIELGATPRDLKQMVDETGEVEDCISGSLSVNAGGFGSFDVFVPSGMGAHHSRLSQLRSRINSLTDASQEAAKSSTEERAAIDKALLEEHEALKRAEAERLKREEQRKAYEDCEARLNACTTESEYRNLAEDFRSLAGYEDASAKAIQCDKEASALEKERKYSDAVSKFRRSSGSGSSNDLDVIASLLEGFGDYEDAKELAAECRQKQAKTRELEKRRAEEQQRRDAETAVRSAEEKLSEARKEYKRFEDMSREIADIQGKISNLESEISKMGLFNSGRKKAAKQEIASLKSRIDKLQMDSVGSATAKKKLDGAQRAYDRANEKLMNLG